MNPPIKHGVPALLSLIIPGLGQVIKGHWVKGIPLFIVIIVIFSGGLVGEFEGFEFFIGIPLWIWNVYDAYNSNAKM